MGTEILTLVEAAVQVLLEKTFHTEEEKAATDWFLQFPGFRPIMLGVAAVALHQHHQAPEQAV